MIYNKKFVTLILLFVIPILLNFYACSYSFTGASVPSHLQTIAIPIFTDRSGSGEPELGEKVTNELINKFISDNTLQVTNKTNSDALLDGTILSLNDAPSVVSAGENVTTRRITITVKVLYRDYVKKKNIFEKNFSNYGDYSNDGDITANREQAIQEAIDKITEDILLGVVSNW
jgi:hypothetical protein